ncbi:MAG TPA: DUF1365 family protein, partial [Mycobacterium sp.]|nr:DUF1365 family protein [Mycobacterium sp.]
MKPDRGRDRVSAALYRTRITHLRRAPIHHYFEHRSYNWYVDVDALPRLPWWVRPFATFEARDHLWTAPDDTLRGRVDAFLTAKRIDLGGGTVTALLHARVLGHVFNPLTLYWCHDASGALHCLIAEVHNTRGDRHAYLLPPSDERPAMVAKEFRASPFTGVDGHYLVRAPVPDENLDVTISLHRDQQPAFVATLRGSRMSAGIRQVLALQVTSPLAPLMNLLCIRVQAGVLRLRKVPGVSAASRPRPVAALLAAT